MPSSYSPLLRFEEIGAGEQSGLWGDTTNKNLGTLVEQAIAGVTTVSLSGPAGDYTLSALNGAKDEARAAVLKFIGSPSGPKNIIIPTSTKLYVVRNDCGQTISVKTAAQITGVTILNGEATLVFCDGSNAVAGIATAGVGPTTVANGGTGATSFTGGFIKSPGGTGTLTSSATVNLATEVTGVLPPANGGTGSVLPVTTGGTGTTLGPSAGQVLIGTNAGTYTPAFLTQGSGITITPSSGGITISASGGVSGVSSFNSRTGTVTLLSSDVTGALGYTPVSSSALSGYAQLSGATFSGAVTVSSGNITATSGNIQVGPSSVSTNYGALVGSSLQLYNPGAQSMFGNSFGFGWIVNNTNAFSGNVGVFRAGIDNTSTLGDPSFRWSSVWAVNGTIQTSDSRLKTDVTPSPLGLNFISKLKPVSYKWIAGGKVEDGTTTPTEVGGTTMDIKNFKDRPGVRVHYGLIAQEVKQTLDELNAGDFAGWALENKDDPNSTQALNYGQFIAPLIKAVQELKAELDEAKAEIAALKAQ